MSDTKPTESKPTTATPVAAPAKDPNTPAIVASVEIKTPKPPQWTKQSLIGKRVQKTIDVLIDPLTGQVYEGDVKITEDNTSGWIVSQIEHGKARIVD